MIWAHLADLSLVTYVLTGPGWIQMASHTCLMVTQLLVGVIKVTEPCVSHLPID